MIAPGKHELPQTAPVHRFQDLLIAVLVAVGLGGGGVAIDLALAHFHYSSHLMEVNDVITAAIAAYLLYRVRQQARTQLGTGHPPAMPRSAPEAASYENVPDRMWFWATLVLSSITIVGFVFAVWELVESHYFRDADYITLHYLYISRGLVSSFLLAFWAVWFVMRDRRSTEHELRSSRARYLGILNCSPEAIALFDSDFVVAEWNASAEQLYGYSRADVIGRKLPTVPLEKEAEMQEFVKQAMQSSPVLGAETQRRAKAGTLIDVQTNLLPYEEEGGGRYFLEVSIDIRERIRLRQTLLQIEKLTTMGQMAAGTAHHLNTPLASMLIRVQLARKHARKAGLEADFNDLEENIRYCQQFVRRLLDFSRRPQLSRRPEPLKSTLDSVLSFVGPQITAKGAHLAVESSEFSSSTVLADRNQLEALFLILLSNAMDAIAPGGNIHVCCRSTGDRVLVRFEDDGSGIEAAHLPHIGEPFFTTKPIGKGTGLGLSIAATILQEHEGRMRIESTPGRGTSVEIELPLSTPMATPAVSTAEQEVTV